MFLIIIAAAIGIIVGFILAMIYVFTSGKFLYMG